MHRLLLASLVLAGTAAAQMPMPPFNNSYTYTDSRGFSFTAPTAFVITGIQVYNETNLPDQCVQVALFPSAPNGTTMTTTQLFLAQNVPANVPVACSVLINPGDEVIIHGGCSNVAVSPNLTKSYSASSSYQSNILGFPVTLYRAGCQGPSMTGPGPFPAFGGVTGQIGRADVYIQSPAGYASVLSFGTGCDMKYQSFYEATAFDNSNSTLSMTDTGNGYLVLPTAGTANWHTPVGTAVTIGDDQVLPFALGWTLPYPGGTTGILYVSSNGFVHAQPQTGSGCCSFTSSMFLTLGGCWAALWADLNPSASGTVTFDTDPITGTAWVTFDQVPQYGSSNLNTFQYSFSSTGTVEILWQTCAIASSPGRGFSAGNAAILPPQTDISAAPVITTALVDVRPLSLAADVRPTIPSTVTLTISEIPANALLSAVVYGLTKIDPGISLAGFGAPGCFQFTSMDSVATLFGSPTASTVFNVPNVAALVGVHVICQGASYAPGVNQLNALSSNGLDLGIDLN